MVQSDGAVGIRWKKWLTQFKNLLLALDVDDTKRQRALLLHYAGESVNEIFKTLPNTEAGEDEDLFEKAATALTNYFTPKKNREYEVYVFRKAKQENGENISAFHTRLRQLAINCEFADNDREIKTQIVQNCLSHKLCMKALQNPELTLTQLLDAMEMSKPWKCQNPKQKPSKRNKTSTNCRGNTCEELRNKIKMAGMLTEILMVRKQPNGIPYPAKVANAGTVAKGTHTRAEKRCVLPMEKVVEAVESKTTMKLCVDQRNPTGNKSLNLKSHGTTFKTLLMKTPAPKTETKMVMHFP